MLRLGSRGHFLFDCRCFNAIECFRRRCDVCLRDRCNEGSKRLWLRRYGHGRYFGSLCGYWLGQCIRLGGLGSFDRFAGFTFFQRFCPIRIVAITTVAVAAATTATPPFLLFTCFAGFTSRTCVQFLVVLCLP
jgi:hypothetical protein